MSLTRSQLNSWDVSHLTNAATRWCAAADESDGLFSDYQRSVGDADWSGSGRDAAYDRVSSDTSVVQSHGEIQRAAAAIAADGANDQRIALQKVFTSITDAEADGFAVAEDLSVRDTRRINIATMGTRFTACREHAENIQWNVEQLTQGDDLLGRRLTEKAAELDGVGFGFDGGTVQAASWGGFKQDGNADDWEPPVIKTEQRPSHEPTVIDTKHEPPPEPEPEPKPKFPNCDNIDVWNNIGQTLTGATGVAIGIAGMPITLGGTTPVVLGGLALIANSLNEMRHCG